MPPGALRLAARAVIVGVAGCGNASSGFGDASRDAELDSRPDAAWDHPTCELVEILSPVVSVRDAVTGKPICDAVESGSDSGAALVMCTSGEPSPASCTGTCPFAATNPSLQGDLGGATTMSAPFSVEVTAPGYHTARVSGLVLRSCVCGQDCPAVQHVVVDLMPSDGGSPADGGPG